VPFVAHRSTTRRREEYPGIRTSARARARTDFLRNRVCSRLSMVAPPGKQHLRPPRLAQIATGNVPNFSSVLHSCASFSAHSTMYRQNAQLVLAPWNVSTWALKLESCRESKVNVPGKERERERERERWGEGGGGEGVGSKYAHLADLFKEHTCHLNISSLPEILLNFTDFTIPRSPKGEK